MVDQAERAARLCKADLVTAMVGEFPELQGIIGGHLARAQGEHPAVADAIRDHYKPIGQGDDVPTDPVTVAVSLADKLDTLVTFFGAKLRPTGSKDPFALRRAALAVLAVLEKNCLTLPFYRLLFPERQPTVPEIVETEQFLDFLIDRLKVQQREAGVRHDLIDAVFALGGEDDLVRLLARVRALQAFVATDDGARLLGGYKRAANILKKEIPTRHPGLDPGSRFLGDEEEAGPRLGGRGDGALSYTPEPCEATLIAALDAAEPQAAAAIEREDFEGAMAVLAALREPIDAFFENVTVNDPDPAKRAARLALLARATHAVHRVADFSRIEG